MRGTLLAVFASLVLLGGAAQAAGRIPVRVVVVTTFELGADTGDKPGEFQDWVERLPLRTVLPFPQGYHPLRYNASLGVLGMVSGEGPARMAASMTALGDDPRFDLSRAYFVLAGIAGIDPRAGSVASAAWAKHVVTGEAHEIDAREIPSGWSTGTVPLTRTTPFEQPAPDASGIWGTSLYTLDGGLVDWAYRLTRDIALPDSAPLQAIRARYTEDAAARRPPFVLEGDTLASGIFWVGGRMNDWAEQWVRYWTHGQGVFATTAEEDGGMMQALTFLSQAHKVDLSRVLVLRTASNYDMPPPGESPASLLAQEGGEAGYSAYVPSLDSAYRVASPVVLELAKHWSRYRGHLPGR
ncbi:purine nucleoside permease [Lichenicoccus sp.]|uniref:purine nucleoside permease n=1 Tax=Lichenicoccus sp. TaxID=2781899 RepID=UPI003D0A9829